MNLKELEREIEKELGIEFSKIPPNDAKNLVEFYTGLRLNKIWKYTPYKWQKEFHEAGANNPERMLMAANRVGKTFSASCEVSYHLTGEYPAWWTGRRFHEPVLAWTGSPTNETSRDIVQVELLGGIGEKLGTGSIPKTKIYGNPTTRQAGVKNVIETAQIRHKSGGLSTLTLKTYEQGWQKFQGTAPHVVWLDEEPDDYMVFSECQTRILTSKGIILVTFTPLRGMTELVDHFMAGGDGIFMKNAAWADAGHLSQEDRDRLTKSYRAHERDARTKGIPMLGEGAVFPVSDEDISVTPFEIPAHFGRIKGCDFGMDHPAAGVELAWDRDRDVVYVIDCYKKEGEKAPYHAAWFRKGLYHRTIPVAWPHDGLNREKVGGVQLAQAYRDNGVNMMTKSARYPKVPGKDETGGAQPVEPIIDAVLERMMTGRFKVFSTLSQWFEEKRSYHRKNGHLSQTRDDILKATFYALMMLRYAVSLGGAGERYSNAPTRPIASTRI
jgi:phage terminase large subunit-like protein